MKTKQYIEYVYIYASILLARLKSPKKCSLGLTPLYTPLNEITERLRHAEGPVDLDGLEGAYREALARLRALA